MGSETLNYIAQGLRKLRSMKMCSLWLGSSLSLFYLATRTLRAWFVQSLQVPEPSLSVLSPSPLPHSPGYFLLLSLV